MKTIQLFNEVYRNYELKLQSVKRTPLQTNFASHRYIFQQ